MKVLVACESSGVVRDAFLEAGHDAWSCDLLESNGHPKHITGNVLDIINAGWDLMIAHPPCTYLSVSGMHWTTRGMRDPELTEQALQFVQALMDAPIGRICIENPVSVISTRIRKPDQIIQPWMFGHDASKKTCLWLKNLPPLKHDLLDVVPPKGWKIANILLDGIEMNRYKSHCGVLFKSCQDFSKKMIWGNQTPSGQNKLPPTNDRWQKRSETYFGIARAMAKQWGNV